MLHYVFLFFFNDTATTEIYTLSLHDALPISPKPNAATKLKNAAHTTAWSGVNTRVETTVAIELAASWKPLMKSKTSATKTMKTTPVNTEGRAVRSRHLEDDPLDDVRDVLAAVGDGLHRLVDLLPLDHLDGVALLLEHRSEERRVG